MDTSGVHGVDVDLVVRPFGWKGDVQTMDAFIRQSVHDHFGITVGQAAVTEAHLMALQLYLAATPLPTTVLPTPPRGLPSAAEPLPAPTAFEYTDQWAVGALVFDDIGCSSCHRALTLDQPTLRLGSLRVPLPVQAGTPVALFSDLRRHDMGPKLASQHVHNGVPRGQYLTRRLWGLNGSAPWLHDGRAPTLDHAISAHGGDALFAQLAFEALDPEDKGSLRIYLMSLRRPWRLVASP
ncbi:MAG: hypothetical protein ACI9WU_002476 [Myxococcota bacterium]